MDLKALKMLILEDDSRLRDSLRLEAEDHGFEVVALGSLRELLETPVHDFDQAIVDLKLGSDSGIDALNYLVERAPTCRVLILTGYASVATAVLAVKKGAVNYLAKPCSFSMILAALDEGPSFSQAPETPSLARIEREHIEQVIVQNGGNITRAAKALGIHRQSLQRKLRKFSPRK